MAGAGIAIQGVAQAAAYLRKERARIEREANLGVAQATLFVEGEVKKSVAGKRAEHTSVDTGRFLGSIHHKVKAGVGTVSTNVKYAKYLEYGTSRMAPRYHFRNTLERNRKNIRGIIAKRLGRQFKPAVTGLKKDWYKPVSSISDVLNI